MARRSKSLHEEISLTRFDVLVSKARKLRSRGEGRKALVALREACSLEEGCAWVWALYGAYLAEQKRMQEAQQAYRHALWLRKSASDVPRVRSLQHILASLGPTSAAA